MRKTILETDRVRLTEILPEDMALLQDLDSDPEVMRFINGGKPSTEEDHKAAMERVLAIKDKHGNRFGVWPAFEKSSNEFMGWFLFRPDKKRPDEISDIELGYRLKKKFWGQGFASEVSRAIIAYGFTLPEVKSIFAIALKANFGSWNVMKKMGMEFVDEYVEDQFPGEDKLAVRYLIKK